MSKRAIFISYSWEEPEHQAWVKKFSDDLQAHLGDCYEVLLDQNLPRGFSLPRFMETGLEDSEKVLVIGTPTYKKKSRIGKGVAFEHTIISTEILNSIDTTKFYPILRKGSFAESFPLALRGRIGDDFTDDTCYVNNLKIVVNAIINDKPIPEIFRDNPATVTTEKGNHEQKGKKKKLDLENSLIGVEYSKDKKTLIRVPEDKKGSFTIPTFVTKIGGWAFHNCKSLTSIEIPDSVTKIGERAFYGCKSLTSIEIPDSVTEIGDYAFHGCKSLTSIEIPDSVIKIGWRAFYECTNLKEIHFMYKAPGEFWGAFWNFDKSQATTHVPKGSGDAYRNLEFYTRFKDVIEEEQ